MGLWLWVLANLRARYCCLPKYKLTKIADRQLNKNHIGVSVYLGAFVL